MKQKIIKIYKKQTIYYNNIKNMKIPQKNEAKIFYKSLE